MARPLDESKVRWALSLLNGLFTTAEVTRRFAADWKLGIKASRRYVMEAQRRMVAAGAAEIEERRAQLLSAAELIFRNAMVKKHHGTALQALRTIAAVSNLIVTQSKGELSIAGGVATDGRLTNPRALQESIDQLNALRKKSGGQG